VVSLEQERATEKW